MATAELLLEVLEPARAYDAHDICNVGNNAFEHEDLGCMLSDFFELVSSSSPSHTEAGQERSDWISNLPDELLIDVISRLSTREAARTSVLGRRWRNMWAVATGSLSFDTPESYWSVEDPYDVWEAETVKYIKWVDDALDSYQALRLGEFRIMFDMENNHRDCINRWILTAFSKRVHTISLHLNACFNARQLYTLSTETLASINISSLVSLSLAYVNVGQEVLEYILTCCPLLEELCVSNSDHLVHLNIKGGPLLKLKILCLSRCRSLKTLSISAPNLMSFSTEFSNEIEIHVESAPRIQNLSLVYPIHATAFPFTPLIAQLRTLKLGIAFYNVVPVFPKFRHLTHLRHLMWHVRGNTCGFESLLSYNYKSLIDAAPFLEKFTVEHERHTDFLKRKLRKPSTCIPYEHLKVVELKGFHGSPTEMELAYHLCSSAIRLQEMIVDLRFPSETMRPWVWAWDLTNEMRARREAARESAQALREQLPQGAKFTILP